jgi:hypothetical protein
MATGLGPLKEDVAHSKDMEDDDKQTKGKRTSLSFFILKISRLIWRLLLRR